MLVNPSSQALFAFVAAAVSHKESHWTSRATEVCHPLALLIQGLLQPLALLYWEAALIQGLLQPLALLDWEATLIQGLFQPLPL